MKNKIKLYYFAPHPVQYHVGIYRELTRLNNVDFLVYYEDSIGLDTVYEKEFNQNIKWDVDLISGYEKIFLKNYSHNPMGGFLSRINPSVFSILYKNRPDVVMFNGYVNLSDWLLLISAKIFGSKIIWRGEAVLKGNENSKNIKHKIKELIISNFLKTCDAVMYSCSGNYNYLTYYGVKQQKMFPIPCSVDNEFFRAGFKNNINDKNKIKLELGIGENDMVIIFTARFTNRKRPLDLLSAVSKISNINITILFVGDGLERFKMEEFSYKHNIKAKFVGFQNQTALARFYTIADLNVVISDYDPSPKALNEAMNFELPVIVTNVVGTAYDLVENNKNGFIVKVGDVTTLANKLDFLNKNRDVLKEMGKKSLEIVSKFNYKENAKGVNDAIQYIIDD
ncbi:glycosyltransferase family 4 protein [Candidatus Thioglobus sp.]|nr:glycosyltransferase family 4 protein [Candidatus Thioglobus sp.]